MAQLHGPLILPDGVRLAQPEELPEAQREEAAGKLSKVWIAPGAVIKPSEDERYSWYAEINVDAPKLWALFHDLCTGLLRPVATFWAGDKDDGPALVTSALRDELLDILEPLAYQLGHDGTLQFGLVCERIDSVYEVFVAPTKHLKVWTSDRARLLSILERHGLPVVDRLSFLDEFPRVTTTLDPETCPLDGATALMAYVLNELDGGSGEPLH